MATWDQSVDLVIVGSGGGALVGALAAADAGLEPLVIEKQGFVGGSTAMSGGIIWMPNNPLMAAEGVPDSHQAGLDYLEAVVGDAGPASSLARRESFLTNGYEMITMLQRKGVKLVRCPGYSDYYDTRKGGNAAGRSIEGAPWDGRQLGAWHDKVNPGMARGLGLAVKTNEIRHLPMFLRSPKSFAIAARVFFRTKWAQLLGQDLFTNGMSTIGQILKVVVDAGIPVWLNAPVEKLIVENGRVRGVEATRDGTLVAVEGRKGVLLAAGGFERNAAMRRKYSGDQPNEAQWTIANPGNTGEVLAAAMDLGAKTDLLDEAWWLPSPRLELAGSILNVARQLPGTIFVDQAGKRFVNESNSYVEVGKAMYAAKAVPCWLIFDDAFRRRYPTQRAGSILNSLPGRPLPSEWIDNGWVKKANSIEELARAIGVDPDGLIATVRRFSEYAKVGQDPDFGRGQSMYNAALGDPGYRPNRALGPIEKPPFYATEIYPSDVGTCGGLLCNEHGQVLGENDEPIPGLYATGNITATVMGRTYPGAGASIANTMAFGYAAARHAAGVVA